MEITKKELESIIYDPAVMQTKIFNFIENASEQDLVITDPTNPFAMLLETAVTAASASTTETHRLLRKKYPDLALTADELVHHLSDDEITNMFSIPSEVDIMFYINVIDIRMHGVDKGEYKEIIIPIGTEVNILDNTLTLLNDIAVRLYKNDNIYIEQYNNDNDISIDNTGVIPHNILHDDNGVSFINFTVHMKQVKRDVYNTTTTLAEGFDKTYDIKGKYYHAEVLVQQQDGRYIRINKAHNEEYLNPSQPTAYISLLDNQVRIRIPDIYFYNLIQGTNIRIELYSTNGEMYLPLKEFTFEQFTIKLGDISKSVEASVTTNIAILANSADIIDGGKNGMTLTELRESIIFNSTGDIDLPVTDYQLARKASMYGYDIYKVIDVVTSRSYIAAKNIAKVRQDAIKANQDVYFNTINVRLSDIVNNKNVSVFDNKFLIKSGTYFKSDNSIVNILTNDEVARLHQLQPLDLINELDTTKHFYTPFYYLIYQDDGYTSSTVFDLDNPTISHLRILNKNITLQPSVNIDKQSIKKTTNGYRLTFTLIGNEHFNNIDKSKVFLQIALPLIGGTIVYLTADYVAVDDTYVVDIDTNLHLDTDGYFDVKNGYSLIVDKKTNIKSLTNIYIMVNDNAIATNDMFLADEVHKFTSNLTVLTKQSINIEFGKRIDYIWNKISNTYTDRKYKVYEEDIPLRYEEDVYQIDPHTNSVLVQNDLTGEYEVVKLHSKDDIVLDEEGNIVYKHKKGDPVLENGNPVIDTFTGMLRYIDICMLELEFKLASNLAYRNYNDLMLDRLRHYFYIDLPNLNNKLLENTSIYFRSYKSAVPVTINMSGIAYSTDYAVKPRITIYSTNKSTYTQSDISKYRDNIGLIVDEYLNNKDIVLENLKKNIMSVLGSEIIGVKIEGLDDLNSELIQIVDKINRLALAKKLELNSFNELDVTYNIDLQVQYL